MIVAGLDSKSALNPTVVYANDRSKAVVGVLFSLCFLLMAISC